MILKKPIVTSAPLVETLTCTVTYKDYISALYIQLQVYSTFYSNQAVFKIPLI